MEKQIRSQIYTFLSVIVTVIIIVYFYFFAMELKKHSVEKDYLTEEIKNINYLNDYVDYEEIRFLKKSICDDYETIEGCHK